MIRSRYGIPTASPGAILREESRAGTDLGMAAEALTRHGKLVPDTMVLQVVEHWLEKINDGFVFDGVPRTLGQAEGLELLLEKRHLSLEVVIALEADLPTLQRRVANRLVCQSCGQSFSVGLHVASAESHCPSCQGPLLRRGDDTLETLEFRMREYLEKTAPLIGFYEKRGLLHRVNSETTPESVFAAIVKILEAE
jgi:adenylate kinase